MDFISFNNRDTYMNHGVIFVNKTVKDSEDKLFEQFGIGAVFFLLICGLLVNLILIIAIKRSPRLKAPIFQLLFALAFADGILLLAYALPEIGDFLNDGKWIFGVGGCTALLFLRFLPTHVASCLIVICCGERFYAVCRPHSAVWITSRKMSAIIAMTWLLNGGVLVPLFAMTREIDIVYSDGSHVSGCYLTMSPDVKKLYFTVLGMLFYPMTAIVSVAFLSCTVCKLLKLGDQENYFIKDDFKNHILRCIAVITAASVIAWGLHYYAYFYALHSSSGSHVDSAIVVMAHILVLASGVMKPILYVGLSSQFRKAVIRALRCCESNEVDFEQTHGYKMHDRLMLAEAEPL